MAVTDAETPRVKLDVRVVLVLVVAVDVGLVLGVCDDVTGGVRVMVRVAVHDALAPSVKLGVMRGVDEVLPLRVGEAVGVTVLVLVTVTVAVAVPDALAPNVKLPVGVGDACGQKHRGSPP